VLVTAVAPAEKEAASLAVPTPGQPVDASTVAAASSIAGRLVQGHLILNALSVVGITLAFTRWGFSAGVDELAKMNAALET